jgi:hypothetical protein
MPTNKLSPTNEERAAAARAALESQGKYRAPEDMLSEMIIDLVSDLLHLARLNDIEPDYIINAAQINFDAEVEDEAGKEGGE